MKDMEEACTILSEEEYKEALNSKRGFCTSCNAVTTDDVQQDAEEFDCTQCHEGNVMGMAIALMMGKIEVVEDTF